MLFTPGNPPTTLPGGGYRALDLAGRSLFDRRRAPVARLVLAELADREANGAAGADAADILSLVAASRPPVTPDAVVDELLPVIMAAQEPPAVALAWVLDRLGHEPALADRIAGEGDPELRDAAVWESLRLRSAALASLRRLTAPRTVAGHLLPAGTRIVVPIPLLHLDAGVFPEPGAFRPERWRGTQPPPSFLPFGDGARRCLGEWLARAYFETILPELLRHRRFRAVRPRPERPVLRTTTLVPQRGALSLARSR